MFDKTLEKLCNANGIAGAEDAIAQMIIDEIKDYCDYQIDNLGNILAFKKGRETPRKKIMMAAHMDEVGFIVTGYTSDGNLSFAKVGGVDDRVIIGRQVLVGPEKIPGVIGTKPIHLQSAEERQTVVDSEKLYVDMGCSSKEEVESLVKLGEQICFKGDFATFGDGCLKGKAIDDRLGCAILIDLIQRELPFDTHFVFCTQEEIGTRGSTVAAYTIAPDVAVVLEATTAADLPGVEGGQAVCRLGKGAVVGFMDSATIYPRDLYELCHKLGAERGIPVQTKTKVAGGNDAGAIHKSRGGVKTIAISAPCRYIHSPYCVVKKSDAEAVMGLCWELLQEIGQ